MTALPKYARLELVRRYLKIAAWSLWIGGLTFYGLVVVPIGADTLGVTEQGFITRQVTVWLNAIGWGALAIFAWDLASSRRRALLVTWSLMAVAQIALVVMHARLDAMLDPQSMQISDESTFHTLHETYLWITTVQWLAALLHLGLIVTTWFYRDAVSCEALTGR